MTLPAQDIVERLRADASGIDDLADDGNFPAHFLERARIYSENAATGADAIERQARNPEISGQMAGNVPRRLSPRPPIAGGRQ